MTSIKRIIVIDDDPVVNKICRHIIKKSLPDIDVCLFTSPEEGLKFIKEEYAIRPIKTILFLDINMPMLNCWEVLKELEIIEAIVKEHLLIYIFSSSISYQDKALSSQHPLVTDFVEKPLTMQKLADILERENCLVQ